MLYIFYVLNNWKGLNYKIITKIIAFDEFFYTFRISKDYWTYTNSYFLMFSIFAVYFCCIVIVVNVYYKKNDLMNFLCFDFYSNNNSKRIPFDMWDGIPFFHSKIKKKMYKNNRT